MEPQDVSQTSGRGTEAQMGGRANRAINAEMAIGIEAIFSVLIFFYQSYTTP